MIKAFMGYKVWLPLLVISALSCANAQNERGKAQLKDHVASREGRAITDSRENKTGESPHALFKKADKLLAVDAFSVVNKSGIPPSGSKHDYMSMGPYYWPNPKTPSGLPYIRKDGEVNPESRNGHTDIRELQNFIAAVKILKDAYDHSGKEKYAAKNIALINAWFINEDTKMNPNLNHGQFVPGQDDGRCFGIIEFTGITEVIAFLTLAENNGVLDMKTKEGMHLWLTQYSDWLKNSKLGKQEATRKNNHGTHYDVQLLSILTYLGKEAEVKDYLTTTTKKRIFSQIEPDGSQPLELARTKSFSYSVMNLHGFLELAELGQNLGLDLWNATSEDGRSLKKGYHYLIPYLTDQKKWEYKQIKDIAYAEKKLISDLRKASILFGDTLVDSVVKKLDQ